jgi:hypothetical protein
LPPRCCPYCQTTARKRVRGATRMVDAMNGFSLGFEAHFRFRSRLILFLSTQPNCLHKPEFNLVEYSRILGTQVHFERALFGDGVHGTTSADAADVEGSLGNLGNFPVRHMVDYAGGGMDRARASERLHNCVPPDPAV